MGALWGVNEGGGVPNKRPSLSFETDVTLARAAGIVALGGANEIINRGTLSVASPRPVRLAANGPLPLNRSDDRRERADADDVWLKAFGRWGDRENDGGDIGVKYSLGGLTLGADKRLTDTLTMGVSYGQAKNHVKADQGLSDGDIDDQTINASDVGAPDASFSIQGRTSDRNGAVLGLGIGYQTKGGFSTLLKYNGELRDHFSAHSIIGELRFEF